MEKSSDQLKISIINLELDKICLKLIFSKKKSNIEIILDYTINELKNMASIIILKSLEYLEDNNLLNKKIWT